MAEVADVPRELVSVELQFGSARSVLLESQVFGMRLAEALHVVEAVLPVAAWDARRVQAEAKPFQRARTPPQGLARLVSHFRRFARPRRARIVDVGCAHSEDGRGRPVAERDLYRIRARHDGAELPRKEEPTACKVFEKRIYAEQCRVLCAQHIPPAGKHRADVGVGIVAPGDANCRRAFRRTLDLRPERVALEGRNIESRGTTEENSDAIGAFTPSLYNGHRSAKNAREEVGHLLRGETLGRKRLLRQHYLYLAWPQGDAFFGESRKHSRCCKRADAEHRFAAPYRMNMLRPAPPLTE